MNQVARTAETITKKSNSNLAFALQCLPKERRGDLVTFYAFCRIIDDIADDEVMPVKEKLKGFRYWQRGLLRGFETEGEVEKDILRIRDKYNIPTHLFLDLIRGCEMDLKPMRFQSWEILQTYTYRVACVVGLISLHIFGANPHRAKKYALKLGHALQITNILRDVGEDLDNGVRIYLPLDDFSRFEYTERDLIRKSYNDSFRSMMQYQCQRARSLYAEAKQEINALPKEDQEALKAAEIMGKIYFTLLEKIEQKNYRVLHQRIKVSKLKKASILLAGTFFPVRYA